MNIQLKLWLFLWVGIAQQQLAQSFSVAPSSHHYCFSPAVNDVCDTITTSRTIKGKRAITHLGAVPKNNQVIDRSTALKYIALPIICSQTNIQIAQAKVNIKPDAAFKSLVTAREELNSISKEYLSTKDYDGMKDYLSNPSLNINNYEENAGVLLASKQLDAESKKEIGTIRRYGVGADVIIMYGSLKAELDEDNINIGSLSKYLQRTKDSLDEVIAICKSNGF